MRSVVSSFMLCTNYFHPTRLLPGPSTAVVAGMNPNSAVSSHSLFISIIVATCSSPTHRPSNTGEPPEGAGCPSATACWALVS